MHLLKSWVNPFLRDLSLPVFLTNTFLAPPIGLADQVILSVFSPGMRVKQEDIHWFNSKLRLSECADVKFFYLTSLTQSPRTEDEKHKDPLGLRCGTSWNLDKALCAARLITCDERELWEVLGVRFSACFTTVLNPWNEQLAIKLVNQFISDRTDEPFYSVKPEEKSKSHFLKILERYAATHIKPQQLHGICNATARTGEGKIPGNEFSQVLKVVPKVKDDDYSEGCLICDRPVAAFTELLRVPRSEMFFKDTVLQYCKFGVALRSNAALVNLLENVEALLVMSFLYEWRIVGAEHSHWKRLLSSCPRSYPTVPLFWDVSDLQELVGTDILDDVFKKREQLNQFSQTIQSVLPLVWEALPLTADELTFKEFCDTFSTQSISFARATFDSRAFNLNIDGSVLLALVPFADMVNHHNTTDVLVRKVEPDGGDFVMLAAAALDNSDVGRELWMSYGPLQNWELLLHYGFVIPGNVHDKLPFPFQITPPDDVDEWGCRRNLLMEKFFLHLHGECWLNYHGMPCEALKALLRLRLAEPHEFEVLEKESPFVVLSYSTEMAIVNVIEKTVRCVLEQFPSSLDDDKVLLSEIIEEDTDAQNDEDTEVDDSHTLDNYRLCLELRIGLKEIAHKALVWCNTTKAHLDEGYKG